MGYVCPVCDAGVADGEQLANHLAVTASLGRTDHREWLAEYAPDWESRTPPELAATVTEYALEVEPPVSRDAPEARSPFDRPGERFEDALAAQSAGPGRGDPTMTAETQQVLEEAMALTEQMAGAEETDDTNDGSGAAGTAKTNDDGPENERDG